MSENSDQRPAARLLIRPREISFGSLEVHRVLPSRRLPSVGPWVFFDHMGPASFDPGQGVDVIPHPHINLATVTYLFDGEIVHRDCLGSVQTITPGAVNLMFASRGIVHSERTGPELRAAGHRLHGLQLWCGLPLEREETAPCFLHYPADALPRTEIGPVGVRVMIGSAFGLDSPVETASPTLYAEAAVPGGGELALPRGIPERAVYVVSGAMASGGAELPARTLAVFEGGDDVRLAAREDSRIALIGGAPLGRRYMWWNFVSSRRERIEQAKADWKEGRFAPVPGETEAAPLPQRDEFFDRR